jgi:hypothetical protein
MPLAPLALPRHVLSCVRAEAVVLPAVDIRVGRRQQRA